MGEDFWVSDWLVQPRRDCIRRDEEVVHLKPKAMAVLVRLAAADGRVVTRKRLFEDVWPRAAVSDAALTQCVVELRHAFGDCARAPAIIETVPRKGFRLIPPVVAAVTSHPGNAAYGGAGIEESGAAKHVALARKWPLPLIGALLLLALAAFGYWSYSRRDVSPTQVAEVKSLAVLPFADLSEDGSQRWFADGLAEDLRSTIVQLRGLRVAGGMSSSRFASDEKDLQAIAEALDVSYVLLGSVRRGDGRARVTARLVEAATGFLLWSETFDRPFSDIFDVQAEISESVAVALSITLGVGELGTAPGGTNSFEAYEMNMRARALYATFSEESILGAIALEKRAVEIDPKYAVAWARLATYSYLAPIAFQAAPPVDFLFEAQHALDRAKSLNPDLPALLPVELDLHAFRRDWAEVERTMSRAKRVGMALIPEAYYSYGIFLVKVGRVREAEDWLRHAWRLEPLEPAYGSKFGTACLLNGLIADALSEHERVWRLNGGNRFFQSTDGLTAALAAGDPEIVARWLGRVIETSNGNDIKILRAMSEQLDQPSAAVRWLREAFSSQRHNYYWIAVFAAYFGDTALALDALLRSPDAYAIWAPFMAEVRREPGFRDLVRKLGLPEYWREFAWADFCRPVGTDDFSCE